MVQGGSSQCHHFSSQLERREGVSKRQAASFLKRCEKKKDVTWILYLIYCMLYLICQNLSHDCTWGEGRLANVVFWLDSYISS